MLVAHHRVHRASLGQQVLLQPGHRGGDPRVLIAQPQRELHREGGAQPGAAVRVEHVGHRLHGAPAGAEQAIGKVVGKLARRAVAHDLLGEAAQVFDQHDAQRDGDRPEFADGEGLHLLVGVQEAAQHLGVEMAVGVGDEGPGEAEHARIADERAIDQLWQLAVIAAGQGGADFADLALDEVVVVDQPFGGGGDRLAGLDRRGDGAVGFEQGGGVVGEAAGQGVALVRSGRDDLRDGEGARVLLQPFEAEQFLPHRLVVEPGRGRGATPQDAVDQCHQIDLSPARDSRGGRMVAVWALRAVDCAKRSPASGACSVL